MTRETVFAVKEAQQATMSVSEQMDIFCAMNKTELLMHKERMISTVLYISHFIVDNSLLCNCTAL